MTDNVLALCKILSWFFNSLREKPNPHEGWKALADLSSCHLSVLNSHTAPLSFCSILRVLLVPGAFSSMLSQGLWNDCSLCLQCFSPRYSYGPLSHFLWASAPMSAYQWGWLENSTQNCTFPSTTSFYPPIALFSLRSYHHLTYIHFIHFLHLPQ